MSITDRPRAIERADRAGISELRFRALVESSSDGIALMSAEGVILYANSSITRILGYPVAEFVGQNGLTLVHPEDLEGVEGVLAELVREPRARLATECRARHKDGSWRWMEATGTNLIDDPSVGALVVNYHDITERKQSEEALREANEKLTYWARQLERHNRELSLIREMGEMLQACHASDEAHRVIARSARELFPDCSGAVYMVHSAKNLAEAIVVWGAEDAGEPVFARDDCWALRLGRPHFSERHESDLSCRHLSGLPPAATLCVPMLGQDETLGVLHIRFGTRDPKTTAAHRQLAGDVAERIVLALDNLKLRETLRAQSIRDPLTRLFNRRYMEESLERELRRSERTQQPVSVIVFDLDHFKEINDTSGHDAGDVMLAAFGEFIQARIRDADIACRYGGEEFVLILPGASIRDAVVRAHKLREGSRDLVVSHKGRSIGPMTLSLGVAVFPDHGATTADLLVAADQALYRAKQQGRDRVEIARTTP